MRVSGRSPASPEPRACLDVQVLHVERVVLDELAPRLDLVAHQRGEHQVGLGVVLGAHLQQRPHVGLHRRRPELLGVHLAEPLVAVDRHALLAGGDEELHELVERVERHVRVLGFAPRRRSRPRPSRPVVGRRQSARRPASGRRPSTAGAPERHHHGQLSRRWMSR